MKPSATSLVLGFFLLSACGGAPEPKAPAKPAAEKSATKPAEPEPAPEEQESTEPKPSRPPSEILLLPDQMYSLAFSSSAAGEKAEAHCGKHRDKPQKRNQCMKQQRSRIKDDVLHFTKDAKGNMFWISSEQRGNQLRQRKKLGFKILGETDNSIELQVKGMARPVSIRIPNDYSIEVPNTEHGTLVYESKIDIKTE